MLKRAVFGLTLPAAERRRPELAKGKAKANVRSPRKQRLQSRHARERFSDESSEDDDLARENIEEDPSSSDQENGENSCEESEEEVLDATAKLALIKKAAALYATDPHSFFEAMKRHDADLQLPKEKGKGKHKKSGAAEEATREGKAVRRGGKRAEQKEAETSLSEDSEDEFAIYDASSSDEGDAQAREEDDVDEPAEQNFRGHFQCKLCPKKIFIFEADLERHLQSKKHLRREAEWEKEHGISREEGEEATDETPTASTSKAGKRKGRRASEESEPDQSESTRKSQQKEKRSQGGEGDARREEPTDATQSKRQKKGKSRDSVTRESGEQGDGTNTNRRKKRQRRALASTIGVSAVSLPSEGRFLSMRRRFREGKKNFSARKPADLRGSKASQLLQRRGPATNKKWFRSSLLREATSTFRVFGAEEQAVVSSLRCVPQTLFVGDHWCHAPGTMFLQ
ncbi:putative zinc finger (C2H2 type) protein [Neospora caninum Liverpool]|uniref:Putative zinc finger (C2H2 type) protein n=1 Tax=Neospora caninum (strain Liverpool) TaxID=572307 RepID=F0VGT2_NEOCL|nr:putative zinc finger (C2H2 type) protein [Neospora caninum Liverpool]CBZ52926.1 putative zinc finger (C2H2 type) protein [Neospora caninum Liverpool]CEL66908.1 TPA: zinc finger (C2H2 type) protein, putative [Neospora caninum Liverpool]|eukprot:XP_003882958.1 putative zinc finger (C2H2 type) protein [Neospora caninum Liverpool]